MSTTLTYGFNEVVNGMNAVMPHASKDDVTPVITGVHMGADGTLAATDRYTVGIFTPDEVLRDGDDFDGAILPIEAVKWVAKMRPTQLGMGKGMTHEYRVQFTFDSEVLNFTVQLGYMSADNWNVEQSATFTAIKGNYPPVARLLPDDTAEFGADNAINLNTAFLARIQTAAKWLGDRDMTARFRFLKTDNPNKPGPVYVEVGDSFKSLIQPNLLRR